MTSRPLDCLQTQASQAGRIDAEAQSKAGQKRWVEIQGWPYLCVPFGMGISTRGIPSWMTGARGAGDRGTLSEPVCLVTTLVVMESSSETF